MCWGSSASGKSRGGGIPSLRGGLDELLRSALTRLHFPVEHDHSLMPRPEGLVDLFKAHWAIGLWNGLAGVGPVAKPVHLLPDCAKASPPASNKRNRKA